MPTIAGFHLGPRKLCFTCAIVAHGDSEPRAGDQDAAGHTFIPIYSTETAWLHCSACQRKFTIIPTWNEAAAAEPDRPGRALIEEMGWDYKNTESAARVVADYAAERITELTTKHALALARRGE